jgi:hypothetical protein
MTSSPLLSGVPYTLVAAGDVQVGALPSLRGDAQYQDFANPRNMNGTTEVGLKVEGASVSLSHPIWGAYRPLHAYSLAIVGQGVRARIWYSDAPGTYGQHHGALVVRIQGGPVAASDAPPPILGVSCGAPSAPVCCDQCSCSCDPPGPGGTPGGGAGDQDKVLSQRFSALDELVDEAAGSCTGPTVSDDFSGGGARWGSGDVLQSTRDLFPTGYGQNWGFTHNWTNDQTFFAATGSTGTVTGGNVFSQLPYLLQFSNSAGAETSVGMVTSGINLRFFNTPASGSIYTPTFYVADSLQYFVNNHQYVLATSSGRQLTVADFSAFSAPIQGQLLSFADAFGNNVIINRDPTTHQVTKVRRTDPGITETYNYSYVPSGPDAGLLSNVTLQRGSPPDEGPIVRQVSFTYYAGGTDGGNASNMQSAIVSDGAGNALDTTYYRTYLAGDTNGFIGGIKMVVGPQSFACPPYHNACHFSSINA